jgi:hypothetical protein
VFGSSAPEPWVEATRRQRWRGEINDDVCVFRDDAGTDRFFIRGHLEIKAPELDEGTFTWSVWVELGRADMELVGEHWDDPQRAELAPMDGVLATDLPYPQTTRGLNVQVFNRPPGAVPFVTLERSQAHPLVDEQRDGITAHRVASLNEELRGR